MKKMVCKYCHDEFCVNDKCPMRADYCPVPNMPGVCKYEERVEVEPETHKQTPEECLIQALIEYSGIQDDKIQDEIYESFRMRLAENGWDIVEHGETQDDLPVGLIDAYVGFVPGQTVTIQEIANSHDWVFDRKVKDHDIHESIVYVTRDRLLMVSFDDNSEQGTVMLNLANDNNTKRQDKIEKRSTLNVDKKDFFAGQTLNLNEVEKSPDWRVKSISPDPFDTSCSYVSKDDKFVIRFDDGATSGVVEAHYQVGESIHVGALGESPYWVYVGEKNDKARYETRDKTMFVAVPRESIFGVIMLSR